MATHSKRTPAQRPPRIIRQLDRLAAQAREGQSSPSLNNYLTRLFQDPAEVCLAGLWFADLSRVPNMIECSEQMEKATQDAAERKDLTAHEGLQLYKAVTQQLNRMKTEALADQERNLQRNFGG